MIDDEDPARPETDDHADVQDSDRQGTEQPRTASQVGFVSAECGEDDETPSTGEAPRRAQPLRPEPRPHAVDPIPQVTAVATRRQRQQDPDHQERLARADEPADEHVDERGDRVAPAR